MTHCPKRPAPPVTTISHIASSHPENGHKQHGGQAAATRDHCSYFVMLLPDVDLAETSPWSFRGQKFYLSGSMSERPGNPRAIPWRTARLQVFSNVPNGISLTVASSHSYGFSYPTTVISAFRRNFCPSAEFNLWSIFPGFPISTSTDHCLP